MEPSGQFKKSCYGAIVLTEESPASLGLGLEGLRLAFRAKLRGLGFRAKLRGLGFRAKFRGLGFRAKFRGLGFRAKFRGLGFRALGFRA